MWNQELFRRQVRQALSAMFFDERDLALRSGTFSIEPHLQGVPRLGLYLHIPFCRQICPYCPYNKEIYRPFLADRYTNAVLKEIELYAELVGDRPITSFYIGGGTPTTMLNSGLSSILDSVYHTLNMQCSIHMESHPSDLSLSNLTTIAGMGVEYLSIGIEALQDRHLRRLCRPYTAAEARGAISRATARGFKCVNVDLLFALPDQRDEELAQEGRDLIDLGVDQVATYPLFTFPYTRWPELARKNHYRSYSLFQKRRMLHVFEGLFYGAGYERTSVWAFTRASAPPYCSVTVPVYLGLGASGASYLHDIFYLNTFSVPEYCRALEDGRLPIALSLKLSERMQMAGWLYWRIYETRFRKSDFEGRFHKRFDMVSGKYFWLLCLLGLLTARGEKKDEVALTDAGAYWLHALQDCFSIDYVSKLWGTARDDPWPREVKLQ